MVSNKLLWLTLGAFVATPILARVGDSQKLDDLIDQASESFESINWDHYDQDVKSRARELSVLIEATQDISSINDNPSNWTTIHHVMSSHPKLAKVHRALKQHPKAKHLMDIQLAMTGGDLSHFANHVDKLASKVFKKPPVHRNRRHLTQDEKMEECESLSAAIDDINLYDLFILEFGDNVDDDDGSVSKIRYTEDIYDKVERIKDYKSTIDGITGYSDTKNDRCNKLLEEFHRNIEQDFYTEYVGATVTKVKRGANAQTSYLALESLRKSNQNADLYQLAGHMFGDFAVCVDYLEKKLNKFGTNGDSHKLFFDSNGNAQIPIETSANANGVNTHGEVTDSKSSQMFIFKQPNILEEFFNPDNAYVYKASKGSAENDDDESEARDFDIDRAMPDFAGEWLRRADQCVARLNEKVSQAFRDSTSLSTPSGLRIGNYDRDGRMQEYWGLYLDCEKSSEQSASGYTDPVDGSTKYSKRNCNIELLTCDYYNPPSGRKRDDCRQKLDGNNGPCESITFYSRNSECPFRADGGSCGKDPVVFQRFPNNPWAEGDYDKLTQFAVGVDPKDSGAIACRLAEKAEQLVNEGSNPGPEDVMPGFCCLDQPFELDGADWGGLYTCDMECKNPATVLSAFSEGACHMRGGTFCPYPRSCSSLVECGQNIAGQVQPSDDNEESNQMLYDFLNSAPTISDTDNLYECGTLREYYGFDPNYPFDDEICEDLSYMKDLDEFSVLNRFNKGALDSESLGGDDVLLEADIPGYTAERGLQWRESNFQLSQTAFYLEEINSYVSDFECPKTPGPGDVCALKKNVGVVLTTLAFYAARQILEISEFNYGENVQLSDYQLNEQYFNTMIIRDNMVTTYDHITVNQEILNDEVVPKLDQVLGNLTEAHEKLDYIIELVTPPNYLSGIKFSGCDAIDQDGDNVTDNCEEDTFPPELQLLGNFIPEDDTFVIQETFASVASAKEYLLANTKSVDDCAPARNLTSTITLGERHACAQDFTVTPLHVDRAPCDDMSGIPFAFVAPIDDEAPLLSCSLQGEVNDVIYVRERSSGPGKVYVDTGLSFTADDSCSDSVTVSIKVTSNEFQDQSVMMPLLSTDGPNDQIFLDIAANSCTGASEYCRSVDDSNPRLYQIEMQASDKTGNKSSSCLKKVVIVPSSYYQGSQLPSSATNEINDIIQGLETPFHVAFKTLSWATGSESTGNVFQN